MYSALLVALHHYASQLVLTYDRSQLQLRIQLERCSCPRLLGSWSTSYNTNYSDTTCGRDAFLRGHGQKVVAFSFYGNSSSPNHLLRGFFQGISSDMFFIPKSIWNYSMLQGIQINAEVVRELYDSSWVMRLYYDIGRDDPLMQDLCQLACNNSNLDICYVREWASQLFNLPWICRQKNKLPFLNIMKSMSEARVQGAARLPGGGHERGVPDELEVPAHAGPPGGHRAQQGPRQQTQVHSPHLLSAALLLVMFDKALTPHIRTWEQFL